MTVLRYRVNCCIDLNTNYDCTPLSRQLLHFYAIPTEVNDVMQWSSIVCVRTYVRPSVCPSRNVARNKRMDLEAPFCAHMHADKISSSANFHPNGLRFTVKDSNRVHWEAQTWLSRKRWLIWQTLPLLTNSKLHMASRLAHLNLTVAHSKGQGQGHAHFDYEYL